MLSKYIIFDTSLKQSILWVYSRVAPHHIKMGIWRKYLYEKNVW